MKIKILILTLTAINFIFSSCSTVEPLAIKKFRGFSEIDQGQTATLDWEFENADYVRVNSESEQFSGKDSLVVRPEETSKYRITAFNEEDSVTMAWRVFVNVPENTFSEKSLSAKAAFELTNSESKSEILAGKTDKLETGNGKIKIMRTQFPDGPEKPYKIYFLPIDANGNFLEKNVFEEDSDLQLKITCENQNKSEMIHFSAIDPIEQERGLNIGLLLENSSVADYDPVVFSQIKSTALKLGGNDKFMFGFFNQEFIEAVPLQNAENANWLLENISMPIPSGLNAFYKSAFKSMVSLGAARNLSKSVLISILYSSDNASIVFNANDIAELSRELSIPVYFILIGTAVESYTFDYLSAYTGSRVYLIDKDQTNKIESILREIILGHKIAYQADFYLEESFGNCSELSQYFTYEKDRSLLRGQSRLMLKPESQFPDYQAVAAFDQESAEIDAVFDGQLNSLATLLRDNPLYQVELIGHAGMEGKADKVRKLSLERAQNVRKELIDLGVSPSQIRVRAEGANMLIYYFASQPWQRFYNRRVEVRWLDPDLMPFELVAEQTWSEETALEKVISWERKGYKAYYQRYLHKNTPIYRVKLWGYKTLAEAEEEALKLSKKFKATFLVD